MREARTRRREGTQRNTYINTLRFSAPLRLCVKKEYEDAKTRVCLLSGLPTAVCGLSTEVLMSDQPRPVQRRSKGGLLLIVAAIALGLLIVGFFGLRSVRTFRELQYIRQQGLDRGTASTDAIRGWMTIRFVAVAYAVPEEYLYSKLGMPFQQRNPHRTLGSINREENLGPSPNGPYPAIIDQLRGWIAEYRENPVATGLRDVRPWMSVRYIANSTGVPEETIFAAIGLPEAGNESKPLDLLSEEQKYPGGPRALADAVQKALMLPKATP